MYYPPGRKSKESAGTGGQEPVSVYLCINSISFQASEKHTGGQLNYAESLKKNLLDGFFSQNIQLKDFPSPQYVK